MGMLKPVKITNKSGASQGYNYDISRHKCENLSIGKQEAC